MTHATRFGSAVVARHCTANRIGRKPGVARGLLIHGGALGDFILSLRIVNAMRMSGMDSITVLARAHAAALASSAGIERAFDLETGGFHELFGDQPIPAGHPLAALLHGFDLTINMLAGGTGGLSAERLRSLTGGQVACIDPQPQPACSAHITAQWLEQLYGSEPSAGLTCDSDTPRVRLAATRQGSASATSMVPATPIPRGAPGAPCLRVTAQARAAVRRRLEALCPDAQKIAIIQPGSGGRDKCWPRERFGHLANSLRSAGWGVVGLLGPVELETWDRGAIQLIYDTTPLLKNVALSELPALLRAANLYFGNDSGVTHLAAGVGTRTVVIFGPTDPRVWRPLGPCVRIVAPSVRRQWPTVADVIAAAENS